jgi:yecA family protein
MTFDEIISALKSRSTIPAAAIREGLSEADNLAPVVFALTDKLCEGGYLPPEDGNLLLFGLNILAAAKHPELLCYLMKLAGQPESKLELVFPLHVSTSLTRLILSVWEGDARVLFAGIEDGKLITGVRWAFFEVISRLTFEGRIPRESTIAFLARLEADGRFADGDEVWWGWEEAVTRLGAKELEPALQRVLSKSVYDDHCDMEREEILSAFRIATLNPADTAFFDKSDIRPIEDPLEAVSWLDRRVKAIAGLEEKNGTVDDDGMCIELTSDEKHWLSGFLASQRAPDGIMDFETLDGFLTALVISPVPVTPRTGLPKVLGTSVRSGPARHSGRQHCYFFRLIEKHWDAIAARCDADMPRLPEIDRFGKELLGGRWAKGFLLGAGLIEENWESLLPTGHISDLAQQIVALGNDAFLPQSRRAEIAGQLPQIVQIIAAYWRLSSPPLSVPPQEIGGNQPCPCYSGKKYKACCGLEEPTRH